MKILKPWLPFLFALFAVGVAWGQNKSEIDNLDDRLTKAEQTQATVNKLVTGQAVIEVRTKIIAEQVNETKRLLEALRAELFRRREAR